MWLGVEKDATQWVWRRVVHVLTPTIVKCEFAPLFWNSYDAGAGKAVAKVPDVQQQASNVRGALQILLRRLLLERP